MTDNKASPKADGKDLLLDIKGLRIEGYSAAVSYTHLRAHETT